MSIDLLELDGGTRGAVGSVIDGSVRRRLRAADLNERKPANRACRSGAPKVALESPETV